MRRTEGTGRNSGLLTFHRQAEQENSAEGHRGIFRRSGRKLGACSILESVWGFAFYSLTCGLEVTATKAAQGGGHGWGSMRLKQSRPELGLRSRAEFQLLSTSCASLNSDIISWSLSSPNCKIRILVVVAWRSTSENGIGATP